MSALLAALLCSQLPAEVPGSWGEPSRAVFLDPAARPILSGLNAVSFDGLPPASTTFTFDGVVLKAPAHALFGPTALHPAWIAGVEVGPGIEHAARGRSLGRNVTLGTRQPAGAFHAVARLDLLQTGLYVEHTLNSGTTLQAALRFFTIPALAGLIIKGSLLLGDYGLRVVQPLGASELRVLALGALDSVALTVSGIPLAARMQGHQVDLRWRSDAQGTLEVGLGGHVSTIGLTLDGATARNAIDGEEQALSARVLTQLAFSPHARGVLGADVELRRLLLSRGTTLQLPDGTSARDHTLRELGVALLGGVHGEVQVTEGEWRTTLGLRADLWKPADAPAHATADPRLTTTRGIGQRGTLDLGLGLMHQAPSWLVTVPVLESASLRYGVQEAARADARFTWKNSKYESLDAHLFGTALLRTLELSPFDENFLQLANLIDEDVERRRGHGWAAGGEVRYRVAHPCVGWAEVSYGLQQSWRFAQLTRFGLDGLPVGEAQAWVPWQHQQTHAVRGAFGLQLPLEWRISFAVTVMSGPPLVGGLFSQDQRQGVDPLRGTPRWVPKDRDQAGVAGAWLRADARASKTWHRGPLEVELFLDVQTLSIWGQPTGTSFGTAPSTLEQQARGEVTLTHKPASSPLPPIPVLGVELRL
ncbi:MAG: hypothetical protein Q8L48_08605 [Archangium sp.]|nr:hypothetical protein [Archangium sp.]